MRITTLIFVLILSACASSNTKDTAIETTPQAPEKVEAPVAKETEKPKTAASESGTKCKMGTDVRTIQIGPSESGVCEVLYTKDGQTNSVASATADKSYCQSVLDKMVANLSNAGFTCE